MDCRRCRRHHHRRSHAGSELRGDGRQGFQDPRLRRSRDVAVLPRARRRGNGHQPDAEARCDQDSAGGADRNLPQAASGRSADARHGDGAVPRHVLRPAQVRLLARRPVEVQHQAVREPGSDLARQAHARSGRFLRHHRDTCSSCARTSVRSTISITSATAAFARSAS